MYTSEPIGDSVHLKECYKNIELIINKMLYSDHKWTMCGDLKEISMLLGQWCGYKLHKVAMFSEGIGQF